MDPSKRICLKNIPPDCTKREIADFIRGRTGAQPHSIDLGLDKEDHTRRYAHFSVEGAKQVISMLSGAIMRGSEVIALPARPHYIYRLAEARRQRERREMEEREQFEALWRERTERWMKKTGGELQNGKIPKSFYATRQRYGVIAAEIAKKLREQHYKKHATFPCKDDVHMKGHFEKEQRKEVERVTVNTTNGVQQEQEKGLSNNNNKSYLNSKRSRSAISVVSIAKKKGKKQKTETVAEPLVKPQPPVEPSKEQRKLSGLQAKLAALRAKMK